MLSHVFLGTNDLERAEIFYAPIFQLLGWRLRFLEAETGWVGWQPSAAPRPLFIVGKPYDQAPASSGNGGMVALQAPDRASVDAVFAAALRGGGKSEGEPGLRPHYHSAIMAPIFAILMTTRFVSSAIISTRMIPWN